jgi:hypothetical protein
VNEAGQTRIVLDEQDADQLLRMLYNGRRPVRVHTLICLCGAIADLRASPKAWNGWQVIPNARCPRCLEAPSVEAAPLYPTRALARFGKELDTLKIRRSHEAAR